MSTTTEKAKREGREAFRRGEERECPYPDIRTWRGGVTFARGRIRAWLDGWDEAQRAAAPSRATDAAPERETRSAATARLTRAQREALEQIIDHGGWLPKYRISGEAPAFRDIRNSQLANREFRYDMEGYAITDAGRAALAAAHRETDDARDATHDGGGER